jgi:tetratricopeptide (TPR) repeat protein
MKQLRYVFLLTVLWSCNKFLDVKPKGVVLPEKLADYEALLNSAPLTETFPGQLVYATDDVQGEFRPSDRSADASAYYWQSQLDNSSELPPAIWGPIYRSIYNTNILINYVEGAIDGTEQQKKEVMGEGKIIKAECYFTLLTAFANAYDAGSAATDPGIPLVNSTDVTEKTPARSSLQESLEEVIRLAGEAATSLPATNINRLRPTKYAAYGLLARVYLYMGDYNKANENATKALEATHELLDYNNYDRETLPLAEVNPETLWARFSDDQLVPGYMIYSDNLLTYLNNDDLRLAMFRRDPLPITRILANGNVSFGQTFPEMYLIQAEALARNNQVTEAMAIVNMIRKKRIAAAAYTNETAANKEVAIQKVLDERRRELAFTGQRWMDMKRLDQEGRMPEVVRYALGTTTVEARLAPHSAGYTFEIPVRVLMFNPQMQTNHK